MAGTGHRLERCCPVSYHHDGDRPPARPGRAHHPLRRPCKDIRAANGLRRCAGGLFDEHTAAPPGSEGAAFLPYARPSARRAVCTAVHAQGHRDGSEGLLAGGEEAGPGLLRPLLPLFLRPLLPLFLRPFFHYPEYIREELKEESRQLQALAATLREQMGDEAYYRLAPVFAEMPFIRPMAHYSQLPNTIRYIDMNPQRLATKRLKPGFFRVQKSIGIGDRSYDGVGNVALLMNERFATVHVRRLLVEQAVHGNAEPLRNYKNGCVLQARGGVVMVSPFISPDEKQVMLVLLRERHPFILLTDNGFRDYYKPADALFDACAEGRLLILSPWPYDSGKRHISRADCVALNAMAEEIAEQGTALGTE